MGRPDRRSLASGMSRAGIAGESGKTGAAPPHRAVTGRSSLLRLVHAPRSRSSRFLWLLEEIGEPYDIQYVSIRRVDGSGALDPANPHPHGKVPFLKDGASTVFEQTAIALYLADKFAWPSD
jgi:Glutathione S-transferase, N-terminal domain